MKTREEMSMFKIDEETSKMVENMKEIIPMFDFEKELPPLMYAELASIACNICTLVGEETTREEKIEFFLNTLSKINKLQPELYLLMMDIGITDIFTINEDGIMVLKEKYQNRVDSTVLSLNEED